MKTPFSRGKVARAALPLLAALSLLAPSAALAAPAPPSPPSLRLCTGREGGLHHRIADTLRKALAGKVDVALIPANGSVDGMRRVLGPERTCDAVIAQEDLSAQNPAPKPGQPPALDRVVSLYPEHVYLLCNPALRADASTALDPATDRINLRPAQAGSHATWRLFGQLAPRYAALPIVELDPTEDPIARLAKNTEPACLFFVSSLASARLTTADRDHPTLRLLPVVDRDLHRPAGPHQRQIFAPSTITAGHWPKLLDRDLETQSVDAVFYVATPWKTAHPAAATALTAALVEIVPTLARP